MRTHEPTSRAAPMARDERRSAIVTATLPLLRQHGHAVTTRQIAEASGIGEGTIFRVFADKAELIDACLSAAFDQAPTLAQLAAVDRDLPLEPRLVAAVRVLQNRLLSVLELLIALGFSGPPDARDRNGMQGRSQHRSGQLLDALAELLEPDADQLRESPAKAAKVLRVLTFAASHPKITDEQPMSAEEIVTVLLHGLARHPAPWSAEPELASPAAGPSPYREEPSAC